MVQILDALGTFAFPYNTLSSLEYTVTAVSLVSGTFYEAYFLVLCHSRESKVVWVIQNLWYLRESQLIA